MKKEKQKKLLIAIDGPSGVGKSTISKILSKKLGILSCDSGAMYRMVAYYCLKNNKKIETESALKKCLIKLKIEVKFDNGEQLNYLNGELVNEQIRENEVSVLSSMLSSFHSCRKFVLKEQRKFFSEHSVIMDGRDIGTVVMPKANFKFFLVADINVRAKRRTLELQERNKIEELNFDKIKTEMIQRDCNDAFRKNSPLKITKKSIIIDCNEKTAEELAQDMYNIIADKFDISNIKY